MKNTNPTDLNGKVAVVTGANGGIGRATVEALCARGARVVMTDMKQPENLPAGVEFQFLDVTDVEALRNLAGRSPPNMARWIFG